MSWSPRTGVDRMIPNFMSLAEALALAAPPTRLGGRLKVLVDS